MLNLSEFINRREQVKAFMDEHDIGSLGEAKDALEDGYFLCDAELDQDTAENLHGDVVRLMDRRSCDEELAILKSLFTREQMK